MLPVGGVTKLPGFCLHSGVHKPWEFLASFPKSYEVIMEHLLQKLMVHLRPGDLEPSDRTHISTLIVRQAAEGPGLPAALFRRSSALGPLPAHISV